MNKRLSVSSRWYGAVPERNGKPVPKNLWARNGRKRKWIVRWYSPTGARPQETFTTKELADEFAERKQAEFNTHGPQSRQRPRRKTLAGFVAELLDYRVGSNGKRLSIGALREYRTVMTRFRDFVGGDVPLDRIVMVDATRYLADLQNTTTRRRKLPSVSTVNKHKQTIKSAFSIAIGQFGYLSVNPFAALKKDVVPEQDIRYITPGEFNRIVEACRECKDPLWWESFVTTCYTAGTRLNEAVHLRWSDIDFADSTLRVVAKPELSGLAAWRPKDCDARTIPIPECAVDLLVRLHAESPDGSEFVFVSPARVAWILAKRKAGTWSEGQQVLNNLNKNFHGLVSKAGVQTACIHDLRRSAITHWARKLASPIVKDLAGHSDINTTLRYYTKIREADKAEARTVTANAVASGRKIDAKLSIN